MRVLGVGKIPRPTYTPRPPVFPLRVSRSHLMCISSSDWPNLFNSAPTSPGGCRVSLLMSVMTQSGHLPRGRIKPHSLHGPLALYVVGLTRAAYEPRRKFKSWAGNHLDLQLRLLTRAALLSILADELSAEPLASMSGVSGEATGGQCPLRIRKLTKSALRRFPSLPIIEMPMGCGYGSVMAGGAP
jgi:hypothetical protein